MLAHLQLGCTRVFDTAIADLRIRYAAERLDFHTFFPSQTVCDIQRIVREKPSPQDEFYTRADAVEDLLRAQQEDPHKLWTLLLLQAFEPLLVRRRRALTTKDDAFFDYLVVSTFVQELEAIPYAVLTGDLRRYVVDGSRRRLAKAMRAQQRAIPPEVA